jgi:hypothetical protein
MKIADPIGPWVASSKEEGPPFFWHWPGQDRFTVTVTNCNARARMISRSLYITDITD